MESFVLLYRGLRFALVAGASVVVGRDAECDIVLPPDPRVSRRHAKFVVDAQGVTVEDLGSRNAVAVDGRVVRRARLAHGSRIAVGLEIFQLCDAKRAPRSMPLTPLPFGRDAGQRGQMITVRDQGDEMEGLLRILTDLDLQQLTRESAFDARQATIAIVATARTGSKVITDPIFERACKCLLGAAERTLEPWWIDRLFELHHATLRGIDSRTLFQLSRLTAVVQRASPEIARRYLEAMGEQPCDEATRARLLRLRLLVGS